MSTEVATDTITIDPEKVRLLPILAVHFIGTLSFSIAIPFLVFVVTDLGGASWTYGLVGATYSAFQLVGAPILGRWSDRTGRRLILVVSQAGTLLAWLLFLVALAMPMNPLLLVGGATLTVPLLLVFAARALDGLTGGNISVASAYVADRTVGQPEVRRKAFGKMGMAASLGMAIGPAVAGLLGDTAWGYSLPVAVAAGVSMLATLLVLVGLPEPARRCPEGPPPPDALTATMHQQFKRCDRPEQAPAPAIRDPFVLALLVAVFVMFLGFNLFFAAFPIHVTTVLGWTPGTLGLFFALLSGVMILAQGPVLGWLSDRVPPTVVFGIGAACLALAFATYALPSTWTMLVGGALFALGNGLAWPTFQARLADSASPGEQGAVQGASTSAGSLASILGLVAGGLLYPVAGVWMFVVVAAIFVVVGVLTPVWFRTRVASQQ